MTRDPTDGELRQRRGTAVIDESDTAVEGGESVVVHSTVVVGTDSWNVMGDLLGVVTNGDDRNVTVDRVVAQLNSFSQSI